MHRSTFFHFLSDPNTESGKEGIVRPDGAFASWNNKRFTLLSCFMVFRVDSHTQMCGKFVSLLAAWLQPAEHCCSLASKPSVQEIPSTVCSQLSGRKLLSAASVTAQVELMDGKFPIYELRCYGKTRYQY